MSDKYDTKWGDEVLRKAKEATGVDHGLVMLLGNPETGTIKVISNMSKESVHRMIADMAMQNAMETLGIVGITVEAPPSNQSDKLN